MVPVFEIAAENASTVNFYFKHQTGIWRPGMNGLESMDYGQVFHALALSGMDEEEQQAVFGRLLHVERGFMGEVNRQRRQ
ncbi:MAG: DUF1799 domain-containing protein [Thiolinea sp.]